MPEVLLLSAIDHMCQLENDVSQVSSTCSRNPKLLLVLCTFKENFSSVCRLKGVQSSAFLSNTNRQTWQVARIENIKCNSDSKSLDPVSTVLLWHLIFIFHGGKTYFFSPSLPPLLPSCCFTNFSFHLRSYGIFPKFPPWFGLETSPSLPGFQASFSISAMWGMILSSCCARGRKVSWTRSCGSCKSKLVNV